MTELNDEVRFPSVSGKFYPIDPATLSGDIKELLKSRADKATTNIKALILPHSAYQFSGEVMASGYSELNGKIIDELFILGFSSFHEVEQSAFADFKYWQTPLGKVEQSHRINQIVLSDNPSAHDILKFDNDKHHGEHTIEVHLPFLQECVSGNFRIIPLLTGKVSPRLLARALDKYVDPEDMIIVSAELSHGYPEDYANDIDKLTIENIVNLNSDFIEEKKCEATNKVGISTLMHIARLRGWKPKLLQYATSADKFHDKAKVSGYCAIGFYL